jgi:hypothetical protein
MKLQDQVCTIEQAKKLKELGVSQESYFSWCGDETQRLMDNGKDGLAISDWVYVTRTIPCNNQEADHREMVPSAKPFAAAFNVAELGIMLPPGYDTMYTTNDGWRCYDLDGMDMHKKPFIHEVEARAAALIKLLENGKISVDEVNQCLTA